VRNLLAGVLGLALAGCTLLTSFDENKQTESSFERCRDRTDNDADGLVDCDDPDCAQFGICGELTLDSCADQQDNDDDGLVDCEDPGCAALSGVCEERTIQRCTDGKDNDGDSRVDCQDSDCLGLEVCRELSSAECSDGKDNDTDGLVDCNDFDCYQQPACCTITVPPFTGDTFSHDSACSIHGCTAEDPICCVAGYELCNPFDPDRWVVWGLPRPRQVGGFVTNEPCGCEASGIVSVESAPLASGSALSFVLSLSDNASSVCAGYTRATTFPDDQTQCSGAPQPRLLIGVCLEALEPGVSRLVALTDGKPQKTSTLSQPAPVTVTIDLSKKGTTVTAGPLVFQAPSPGDLSSALVLAHGRGTGGKMSALTVSGPGQQTKRCASPSTWYRHLARGEPVIRRSSSLLQASHPTVIYRPDTKDYFMLLSGITAVEDGFSGVYSATSTDGVLWSVSDAPVFPLSATDTTFGVAQSSPALLRIGSTLHVWYARQDVSGSYVQQGIAHATSLDGVVWKPDLGTVGQPYVLTPGQALTWDSLTVSSPSVAQAPDGSLLMWYTGTRADSSSAPAIGLATSKDGTTWLRPQPQPVLAGDPDGDDLALEDPSVIYDPASGLYRMWYTHRSFGKTPTIRYAVSTNGLAWSRWPTPVFTAGPLGVFDERGVTQPTLLLQGYRLKLWYTGSNSKGVPQIGYSENRGAR